MSTRVENPATIRDLTRYVEREHPCLRTSHNARREQLVVVGQPGKPEPPASNGQTYIILQSARL
jgi:hypothetical protein